MGKVEELKATIKADSFTEEEQVVWASDIAAACKALEKRAMRRMIIETGERADGRTPEQIRPLYIRPGYLPARARVRPVPARPNPGAFRVHPRHAERVAAPGHHRPG